jgi:hypothetical protein
VRPIPAIQQRGVVHSRGRLGPRVMSWLAPTRCPAAGPCHQLRHEHKRTDRGDGYGPRAAVRQRTLALAHVVGGRRGLTHLVLVVCCGLRQLAVIAVAASDLDAPLGVCAQIDREAERDQSAGEQCRADQHVRPTVRDRLR